MFNTKLTQSIAEAAKKVMDEELKGQQHKIDKNKNNKIDAHDFKLLRKEENVKEEMQKSDVPAYLRKQQGEKPLTMADVKGPRKDSISSKENLAKARNEEVEQVTEADVEKTATGMKVYGSSYGNSVRARREQVKKAVDTVKGPKMKDIASIEAEKKTKKKFSEMVESYVESGIKGLFESFVKEEVTNDQFKKELDKQQAKADGKAPQADVAKAAVQAVQQEEVEQLDELMGKGQLPKIAAYHKQKGDEAKGKMETIRNTNRQVPVPKEKSAKIHAKDAESTYHYTQAKRAKALMAKEEVEQLDELSPGTLKSYAGKAQKDLSVAKQEIQSAGSSGDDAGFEKAIDRKMNREAGIKKAKERLNKEEVEQIEERSLTEPETKKKEEVVKSMKKGLQGFKDRYGADAKSVMYATATKIAKKD